MNIKKNINAREEALLNYLWKKGAPLTSNEMLEDLQKEGWKQITLLKTIQTLSEKEYLEVVGLEKTVKTYARRFAPTITKEVFYSQMLTENGVDESALVSITAALIGADGSSRKGTKQIIQTLESIIEELKAENGDIN